MDYSNYYNYKELINIFGGAQIKYIKKNLNNVKHIRLNKVKFLYHKNDCHYLINNPDKFKCCKVCGTKQNLYKLKSSTCELSNICVDCRNNKIAITSKLQWKDNIERKHNASNVRKNFNKSCLCYAIVLRCRIAILCLSIVRRNNFVCFCSGYVYEF